MEGFHISRLELALQDSNSERNKKPEPPVFLDQEGEEEEEYQINSVVEHSRTQGRRKSGEPPISSELEGIQTRDGHLGILSRVAKNSEF
jgi:hypothetical protein